MAKMTPYLGFDGNCREAMEFYHACLGGHLTVQTVGESPAAAHMPADAHHKVMHAVLVRDGQNFLFGSDMMSAEEAKPGKKVSLCITGKDKEEITSLFDTLSAGGKPEHPLKDEFFGMYGDLVDKFGIRWMFQSDPPEST